jgi:hypothetical protein
MRVSLGKRLCRFCHENIYIIAKQNTAFHLVDVTGRMSRGRNSTWWMSLGERSCRFSQ